MFYGIILQLINAYFLFIWWSNKSTRDQLKTNWSSLFQRGSSISTTQYLTFYTVHLCKQRTHINCTDRSIWKAIVILLLSSWSVLKMTNISPYGIWLSRSNFNSRRPAPTCWVIFSFIDVCCSLGLFLDQEVQEYSSSCEPVMGAPWHWLSFITGLWICQQEADGCWSGVQTICQGSWML